MSFAEAIVRQQDAVFDRLGEDAEWTGAGVVRVRLREADDTVRLEYSELIALGRTLKVRRSEIPNPASGQTIQMLDAAGGAVPGGALVISGEPTLDRRGVWTCPVRQSA